MQLIMHQAKTNNVIEPVSTNPQPVLAMHIQHQLVSDPAARVDECHLFQPLSYAAGGATGAASAANESSGYDEPTAPSISSTYPFRNCQGGARYKAETAEETTEKSYCRIEWKRSGNSKCD